MTPLNYFETHPVFTKEEFVNAHGALGGRSPRTSRNILAHHVNQGRLIRIRRGLYATVPRGFTHDTFVPDPYQVATKITADATVAYLSALQFFGKAHSVSQRYTCLTQTRGRSFEFRGSTFVPLQLPSAVRDLPDYGGGIELRIHRGGQLRITSLERTMVDVLDAPERAGGWEEIWRSLESVEYFDLDAVVETALRFNSALTAARVGFFLEQNREQLMVEPTHLEPLRGRAPARPLYLDRKRAPGKLVPGWNLVVPRKILERSWEEPT